MKIITMVAITLLALTSCNDENQKSESINVILNSRFVEKVNINGHDYLQLGNGDSYALTHSGQCMKCFRMYTYTHGKLDSIIKLLNKHQ